MFDKSNGNGESQNPAQTWYQDQLNIFDNIGIPLAKKLKESKISCMVSYDIVDLLTDFTSPKC